MADKRKIKDFFVPEFQEPYSADGIIHNRNQLKKGEEGYNPKGILDAAASTIKLKPVKEEPKDE